MKIWDSVYKWLGSFEYSTQTSLDFGWIQILGVWYSDQYFNYKIDCLPIKVPCRGGVCTLYRPHPSALPLVHFPGLRDTVTRKRHCSPGTGLMTLKLLIWNNFSDFLSRLFVQKFESLHSCTVIVNLSGLFWFSQLFLPPLFILFLNSQSLRRRHTYQLLW